MSETPERQTTYWPPSKEWCERMADLEGNSEIGAGLIAVDPNVEMLACPKCGGIVAGALCRDPSCQMPNGKEPAHAR